MDLLYDSHLSWFQFIVIALVLFGAYFLITRYRKAIFWITGLHNLALPNSILVILAVFCFVLVNPLMHGVIFLFAFALFYQVLSSYIKGMIVTSNSKIEIGDLIRVGQYKGKVAGVNLAGIKLLDEKNNLFVPYHTIVHETIEKFESDQATYFTIRLTADEDQKGRSALLNLESVVFNFPFLEGTSNIEIKQIKDFYEVRLTLANDRFRNSLYTYLKKSGFSILEKVNN